MPANTQPFYRRAPYLALATGLAVNYDVTGVGGAQSTSGTVAFDVVPASEIAAYAAGVSTLSKSGKFRLTLKGRAKMNSGGSTGSHIRLIFRKNAATIAQINHTQGVGLVNTFTKTYLPMVQGGTAPGAVPVTSSWDCEFLYIYEGQLLASDAFDLIYSFNEGTSVGAGEVKIGNVELTIEELT